MFHASSDVTSKNIPGDTNGHILVHKDINKPSPRMNHITIYIKGDGTQWVHTCINQ